MKTTLLMIVLCLFAVLSVSAQGNVQKDVDAIKKMETEMNTELAKGKADAFKKYVHMNARIVTPDAQRTVRDAISSMVESGALKFTSSVISDLKVLVFIDTAIASYDTDDKGTVNGAPIDGKTRWTDTWARIGGNWTCIAIVATPVAPAPAPKTKARVIHWGHRRTHTARVARNTAPTDILR